MTKAPVVVTFTLNPCLDKTVMVDGFSAGALNRITSSRFDYSGKGINLGLAFNALGGSTVASGFMYGADDAAFATLLNKRGIGHSFVNVDGRTRENLKVLNTQNSQITEINEPGGLVQPKDIEALKQKVKKLAKQHHVMAFSGSIPQGVAQDIYYDLVKLAKQHGAFVVLDTEKQMLTNGLKAKPDMIKPNLYELQMATGKTLSTKADSVNAVRGLMQQNGVRYAGVTLGADGGMLVTADEAYFAPPLPVVVQSATGAGDTFVAGMLYAHGQKMGVKDMLRYGMAAAADAVTHPGTQLCERAGVEKLLDKVYISSVD